MGTGCISILLAADLFKSSQGCSLQRRFAAAFILGILSSAMGAQPNQTSPSPKLGAQIWIEPGQTPEQIDGWFKTLADAKMPIARIFLMWSYLEPSPDRWDFSLYDAAFASANKYHVHVVATLTPSGPPPFLGGDGTQGGGVLPTEQMRREASVYIGEVVHHYQASPALDTWLLVNEPGQPPQNNPVALTAFRQWLVSHYSTVDNLNHAWGADYPSFESAVPPTSGHDWNRNPELDWRTFWETYQTAQLQWLADQVHAIDKTHPLHLNPAGILDNPAALSDDLPSWRPFLDTLGCSIHPAWHFGLLQRDQYALGVSYLNDLVRGSIEPKPYWITELQGGNNIYSGLKPMEPTPQDIAQWVWTSLGSGANRVIFWLLNARREGVEAGEWSLLNFQNQSSARLTTAASIARTADAHNSFFAGARPYRSPATIILSLSTLTFEEVFQEKDDPARDHNAHILSALGFYRAFSQLGVPPEIKFFEDYDWEAITPEPRLAVLPDARLLTAEQIKRLEDFVAHGNTLLITGLTGFYGPHALAWPLAGFPLAAITGASMKEVHLTATTPFIPMNLPQGIELPSRFWIASLAPSTAKAISSQNGRVLATERDVTGGGKVLWIPSPIGLGAWLTDEKPLAQYLQANFSSLLNSAPFLFIHLEPNCLIHVLTHGHEYVTVVTNQTAAQVSCSIAVPGGLQADPLWGTPFSKQGTAIQMDLPPRGTSVLLWH
jgi:beta-galactosidase